VQKALANPRQVDQALVDAYLARRALDYLVGFTLSPVLWRKLPGARSAGRVQSVALRIVCDREREIEAFRAREYWSLVPRSPPARRRLRRAARRRRRQEDHPARHRHGRRGEAFKEALETAAFSVANVEAKPVKRHPYPPFQTSTLQQEASRKLGIRAGADHAAGAAAL
jgi:DNA topoisomerase-1